MQQSTRKFQAIIGLGNPGKRYLETRHNAGFQVVDRLHQIYDGLTWKKNNTAWTSAVSLKGKFVRLLKPATFMNHSGLAVSQFVMKFLLDPTELIVIHDDLDIELERVKVKLGGGHAGHKGVKSIVEHLKTVDFARVRVGIGRPEKENAIDFVFGNELHKCFFVNSSVVYNTIQRWQVFNKVINIFIFRNIRHNCLMLCVIHH